jgi:hypothetical protein
VDEDQEIEEEKVDDEVHTDQFVLVDLMEVDHHVDEIVVVTKVVILAQALEDIDDLLIVMVIAVVTKVVILVVLHTDHLMIVHVDEQDEIVDHLVVTNHIVLVTKEKLLLALETMVPHPRKTQM